VIEQKRRVRRHASLCKSATKMARSTKRRTLRNATASQASNVQRRISNGRTGEGGIRTLGSLLGYGALAKRCFQPLSHLTKIFYRARLSHAFVKFLPAWSTQSLKGLFQPKAITAAMIKISTNSRRRFMSKIVRKNDQSNPLRKDGECLYRNGHGV
jgi:hypothetical protein